MIHCQLIGYSWTPLCRTQLSRTPRYLEQNRISLGFALIFSVIYYYGLSWTRLPWTPRNLEPFLAPLSSSSPRLSQTLLRSEETLVKISQEVQTRHVTTRCTESWELYWRVHGNESKVRLTGLTTANAEGNKLPVFVNFRDQPEIWCQPRYLEPLLSQTICRNPWEFKIAAGSTVLFSVHTTPGLQGKYLQSRH